MQLLKDSPRALVRMLGNGSIEKVFRHRHALVRLQNEVRVLRHLEQRGCPFVPRLIEVDAEHLRIIVSNCGQSVQTLPQVRVSQLFASLTAFGVRHDDPVLRNVTYDARQGQFCVIDFEYATLLDHAESSGPEKTIDDIAALLEMAFE